MSLINIQDACLSFSNLEILKNGSLYINEKERVCLMGKNGTGKSTLLKIINKKQDLDHGQIIYKNNIQIAYLQQENPKNINISVYDFISSGLDKYKKNKKKTIHEIVEIEKIIEIIQINKSILLSNLSGGLLRKVALGHILIQKPDILLLDEPTNHLDIKTVKWLEIFLKKFPGSILFVSHDRNFIQNIATRIIDLDRGKLVSWPGDYQNFIKLKNESNRIEKIKKKLFDKNLEKEEIWIRRGVKARTTRNEGRVKNIKILRKEYENYKKIEKLNNIQINQSNKNYLGKIIFKIENLDLLINDKIIIKDFSSTIQHGDKIGIIGDNGCGKSTIIKVLIGEKTPQRGKVYTSTGLKISYFDQNRLTLDPNKSIIDNISHGKEIIKINKKEQHIVGYLKNFLFKPNQLKSLVKTLSGGECNRLLLARLFLKPSNVLILDEPTNDLDLDTLELLEKIIIDYKGTVLIVSHDEKFIKNTVNKYWLFEKNGLISIHSKNYNSLDKELYKIKKEKIKKNKLNVNSTVKSTNILKKEINDIFLKIEKIELKIKKLQNNINKPNFFKKKLEEKLPILKMLTQNETELAKNIIIWENLERKLKK